MNKIITTVTLSEAQEMIKAYKSFLSVLLLAPPGVGKTEMVMQAARDEGLPCRSLLGTQIAPEDVSGIPRINGKRVTYYPPRLIVPEDDKPFVLFLDELPNSAPDVQKSMLSLLLEHRVGEFPLPKGTWVVAAGNRLEDRSYVRPLSAALVNRVIVLSVRVDVKEWLMWAHKEGVRSDVLAFITYNHEALNRPVPVNAAPFSTPRSWVKYSKALDLLEKAGNLSHVPAQVTALGLLSREDAVMFPAFLSKDFGSIHEPFTYLKGKADLPKDKTKRWFVINGIRQMFLMQWDSILKQKITSTQANTFLGKVEPEERASLLLGLVNKWERLGAIQALLETLKVITGIEE